ncbi:D-xylose isomerase [Novosphingobium aromaticivorans DSM 12444]|uniref:Xylose isomerase n=1 Tax=Novosphingobium aromaticivorans (strain ATCC 700278 / DSM 12444 / CCUG 56034 / CIP 105152 / NBRC 16084 / F199) TaxID=279238 RepID=XYLA_NOVAD|nr:xylose isomerase [Novosphingobium aromaticivorans]Q2GAB9.1 RecName: Full=Xylose isomerase [Novosphingobium aromaticivorans DSM 12444]ABD25204.1 D-xylose isomerase [Novosphingobium aromaticivorans DSM 12444]SCX86561.1 D-xylose isomerase [Novosphingobium aromaticivorans]
MSADYFADFQTVRYEGPDSDNDFAYRWYDKDRVILGKRMEDHLRFAVCMWHTFCWPGSDVFGAGTFTRPWLQGPMDARNAAAKREAALAFVEKLDVPFYCFHDVDVMAEAEGIGEFRSSFAEAVDHLEELQGKHGRKLLWGTANLFGHPRYMAGAATNPDPEVFAWGASQVRDALEATHRLGGANYVLWGGREGYDSILNTEIGIEQENFGRFLSLVVDHKHRIGFKGTILIEPKPHEPTKHQYDFDTQTVFGFLKRFGLESEVKVNIEANHATLSGHTFEHELAMARALGILGSIDANRGDHQNGWDTDQFPNSVEELTLAMLELIRAGGFTDGGFNFDAKVRRQSIDAADLFHGHIGGIDTIAHALVKAAALIEDGKLDAFRAERYAGWQGELGRKIHADGTTLADIADIAVARDLAPVRRSGRQEWCENLINRV